MMKLAMKLGLVCLVLSSGILSGQDYKWFVAPHIAYNAVYHQQKYGLERGAVSPFVLGASLGVEGKVVKRFTVNMYAFQNKEKVNSSTFAKRQHTGLGFSYDVHFRLVKRKRSQLMLGAIVGASRHFQTHEYESLKHKSENLNFHSAFSALFRISLKNAKEVNIQYAFKPLQLLQRESPLFFSPPYSLSLSYRL